MARRRAVTLAKALGATVVKSYQPDAYSLAPPTTTPNTQAGAAKFYSWDYIFDTHGSGEWLSAWEDAPFPPLPHLSTPIRRCGPAPLFYALLTSPPGAARRAARH
jgi:hypothetical protein